MAFGVRLSMKYWNIDQYDQIFTKLWTRYYLLNRMRILDILEFQYLLLFQHLFSSFSITYGQQIKI